GMARGELLAGFALSEPESGSDAAALRTRAVRDGDRWVLSGAKAWATNGATADLMMVMARTERGISAFIVPTDTPGYRPGKPEEKMGLRASNTVALALEDVATRVEAARALAHVAGARRDRGEDVTTAASMAKLFASETAMWVTTQAVQLFGGYGYMRDFPVEKLFRDAKVTEIYEGTSEIQRIIVARGLYPGA